MTRRLSVLALVAAVAGCLLVTSGTTWGAVAHSTTSPVVEITQDARISDGPTVVVTPAGTAIAVWIERSQRVMASSRSVGTPSWSVPVTVANNGFYANVATYGSDSAVITWQGFDKNSDAVIRARTVHNGVTWGQRDLVSRWVRHGGVPVALTVAANDDGKTLIAWTRRDKVRAAYGTVGGTWSEPHTFRDIDSYSYDAVANVRPSGEADLVFPANRSGRLSTLRAYHMNTSKEWQGETVAKFATGLHASGKTFDVAINSRGDAVATWMRRSRQAQSFGIHASYRSAEGTFSTPRLIATGAHTPVAAIDRAGAASVAFLETRDSATATLFAYRSSSGYWTRPAQLSTVDTSTAAYPAVDLAVNSSGDFFVQSQGQHAAAGVNVLDHRLTHCVSGVCGADQVVKGPRGDQSPTVAVRPAGAVDVVWTFGCATEECIPTGIRAVRFHAR
ncbi:MAG: hypothetical protein ACJ73L_02600 [Actinomycetes bacterium]